MTDVFISYSRRDKEFVQQLHMALKNCDRQTWVDWQDIPLTADWWQEIERGIEGADTFIFVISPDAVASKVCRQEIDHSVKHNKRLLPIVRREGFDGAQVHEALSKHNWLFFREQDDFDTIFQGLLKAIDTDLNHVRLHTRLLVRALEWEYKSRNDSFLLRGSDLEEAEQWLAQATDKEPHPTEQQTNYIHKSREAEDANQRLAIAGQKAKRMVRVGSVVLSVALGLAAIVGVMTVRAFQQLDEAKIATRLERAGANALSQFNDSRQLDALLAALNTLRDLDELVGEKQLLQNYPTISPIAATHSILDNIRERNIIQTQQRKIYSINFNSGGDLILTGGENGTARLWYLSGQLLQEFIGSPQRKEVSSTSFSPDGSQILLGRGDGTVQLWNLSGDLLHEFVGHEKNVWSVGFSPDGKQIITAAEDGTVRLWNISGEQLVAFRPHQGLVWEARFSPDGKQILTAGQDSIARLWRHSDQRVILIAELKGHQGAVASANYSPDGQRIITGSSDDTARLWSFSGQLQQELRGHQGDIWNARFSPDSQKIITGSSDGTTRIWSLLGRQIDKFEGVQGAIFNVSFNPNGRQIAAVGTDGNLWLWDLERQDLPKISVESTIQRLDFSSDGRQILIVKEGGIVQIRRADGQKITQFNTLQGELRNARFSSNSRQILTIGTDGTTILQDFLGQKIVELESPQAKIWDAEFSANSQQIVTTGQDGVVRLWNLLGEQTGELKVTESSISSVDSHPRNDEIVTGERNGTIRLWNSSGQLINKFDSGQDGIWIVKFSPNGQQILTYGEDRTIRLWNLEGQEIAKFRGREAINAINFSPDSKQVITIGRDSTVMLWTIEGQQLSEYRLAQDKVVSAIFTPDNQKIAIAENNGTIRFYPVRSLNLKQFIRQGCNWLKDYLQHSLEVNESDRQLCVDVLSEQ